MRVLIVGASGFIGQYLVRRLNAIPDYAIVGTFWSRAPHDDVISWRQVGLADSAALEQVFQMAQPDVVVHLAAMADVGTAERNPQLATAVNVTATSTIARLCQLHGARLVFVSTEYVFDGRRGYYREDEPPNPTTHYGLTKYQAEQEVAKLASPWSVLRTSIVYGWPAPGKRNFVPGLVQRLSSGEIYQGPTDVYRTPVYVEHLTRAIARLVEEDFPGIHHVAGSDSVSMYQFASAVAEAFQLDPQLVVPAASPPGRSQTPDTPDLLGLDCATTIRRLGLEHPGLTGGLAAMKANSPTP